MNRSNTIRRISAICRGDSSAALWALGYLVIGLSEQELRDLLGGLEEFEDRAPYDKSLNHLELVRERFGDPQR